MHEEHSNTTYEILNDEIIQIKNSTFSNNLAKVQGKDDWDQRRNEERNTYDSEEMKLRYNKLCSQQMSQSGLENEGGHEYLKHSYVDRKEMPRHPANRVELNSKNDSIDLDE